MAITLAADGLSDAELTDGIARGDIASAARLWVRLWPTALNTAREVVEPAEVPGLAAKALIGTIAVIAVGRGPREDVKSFLRGAVRELGGDGPPPRRSPGTWSPDVSKSPIMSGAFARLPDLVQDLLRITVVGDRADEMIAEALEITTTEAAAVRIDALTTLQRDHLAAHADGAEDPACRPAHHALALAVEDPGAAGLSRETWMHLSACAWCTEAFHEVVFSNAAIGALVDRAAPASQVVPPSVADPPTEVTDGGGVVEPALVTTHVDPPPRGGSHVGAASASPEFVRRRGRGLAGAVAVLGAVAVAVLIVVGHGSDGSAPVEAAGPPTSTSPADASVLPGASPSLTSTSDATTSTGTAPGTVVDDLPSATPTPRASKSPDATSSPRPAPSPQPGATTTTSAPAETPSPTPEPPPPTPTQTPTPTPTPSPEPCSLLEHLLGLC